MIRLHNSTGKLSPSKDDKKVQAGNILSQIDPTAGLRVCLFLHSSCAVFDIHVHVCVELFWDLNVSRAGL